MKTSYLIPFFFCCLIFDSFHLNAQDEKHDAGYRSIIKEYTLNPDGSADYRYIKEQKLHTYRAFHNLYGETFVVYNPTFQKLKINEVYTVMADGKKIVAPPNAFNEVLPGYAANAPAYNSLREMVITHTGLERKATINLDYQIHTEKGYIPALMGNELLAENEPIETMEIRVRIPVGQNLYYKLFNAECLPEKRIEGGYQVYIWKLTELPAILVEEAQQGLNERYPRLVFSTSDDLEKVRAFLTNQPAFRFFITGQMKNEADNLMTGKGDKFEQALKMQERVVDDMRLYPIPLRVGLYQCRTPEQIWSSNGGTLVEKAVLFASLLKSAGLNANVVGIVRTAFTDDHIATLADIEDFAVQVEFKDRGTWYFSLTGLNGINLKYTLPGRSFIVLKSEEKVSLIKAETPTQMVNVSGKFIVSSDPKLTGEISIRFDGSIYPYASLLRDKNKIKNSLSGGLIGNDTNNLKSSALNTENGFQTFIAQSDKPFRKDSNLYYFTLPVVISGIDSWGIRTLSKQRVSPYEIPALAEEGYSYTLTLPANMRLFTPQKKQVINNKAGTFTWEVSLGGGKVTVTRQMKFNDRIFSPSNYNDFKIIMDYWNNPWYRQIIFISE